MGSQRGWLQWASSIEPSLAQGGLDGDGVDLAEEGVDELEAVDLRAAGGLNVAGQEDAHISWTVLGATSAQTQMTPTAPVLMSGTTMSSLPLIMWKSSERQWAMSAA